MNTAHETLNKLRLYSFSDDSPKDIRLFSQEYTHAALGDFNALTSLAGVPFKVDDAYRSLVRG
jgi:hypothetical protein